MANPDFKRPDPDAFLLFTLKVKKNGGSYPGPSGPDPDQNTNTEYKPRLQYKLIRILAFKTRVFPLPDPKHCPKALSIYIIAILIN